MAQFDDVRADAIDAVTTDGRVITVTRNVDNAAPDPTKPWRVATSTPAVFSVMGVVLPYLPGLRSEPGEPEYEAYLLPVDILGNTFAPQRTDVVTDSDNVSYQLDVIAGINPDGAGAIIYACKASTWPRTSSAQQTHFSAP